LFLQAGPEANATLINIRVDGYSGNFIDAVGSRNVYTISSQFINIDSIQSTPFIKISQLISNPIPVLFMDVLFENITVKHSIFLIEKPVSTSRISTFVNITMRNITKKEILNRNVQDHEYEQDWIGGLCLLAREIHIIVNDSSFENINSHCIGLNTASVHLNYDIFNNSGLEAPSKKLTDDSISETDGVSWLNSRGELLRNKNNIISCKFIENKIAPKYGGVNYFPLGFSLK